MNLCLRSNGRKKCAEIAEQAITVLASLLAHPNDEVISDCSIGRVHYSLLSLDSSVRELVVVFNINDEIHTRQSDGAGK